MPDVAAVQAMSRNAGAKLEGKTYGSEFDPREPWVYYDTDVLAGTAVPVTLFNNSAASGKTLSQTNYPYQQMPAGQAFDITGLRASYYSHALQADATQQLMLDYLNAVVVQVSIVNKVPMYERSLAALIGGAVQAVTAPAVTVGSRNLSVWTGNTVVKFKEKITIDKNTPWYVKLLKDAANNAALNGDYVRIEMLGRLYMQV